MNKYLLLMLIISFFQCKKKENFKIIDVRFDEKINKSDSIIDKENWFHKDILEDSLPGLSIEKARKTILKNKKSNFPVIVAVIDNKFDINHESIKDFIWTNTKETLNYKDDDNNGFVDDIYGWNFIGNPEGNNVIDANYEYVRYVRYYRGRFENQTLESISDQDKPKFILFNKAKEKLKSQLSRAEKRLKYSNGLNEIYIDSRNALHSYFPDYEYSLEKLNKIDTINNNYLADFVKEIKEVIKWKETDEMKISLQKTYEGRLSKRLNIDFNEREVVGDNPYDINDTIYGNNKTFNLLGQYDHGTRVASIITAPFKNISNTLKLITLSTSPSGSHHDKDLALAIRYAVNKGAKVINMSFRKDFSLHPEWVFDAFKYAEKNNVLIVGGAGNNSYNLDTYNITYPMDNEDNEQEICDNFLLVGASSYTADENLRSYFSSYGKIDVDIFAPGTELYSAYPFNKYKFDSGTSLSSALTSGTAALIFSYYPNLTASQVKHIIMDSGVEYTFPVKTPTKEDKNKMTPFNELSKSGKIVNAYNALIMADSVSEMNKRK